MKKIIITIGLLLGLNAVSAQTEMYKMVEKYSTKNGHFKIFAQNVPTPSGIMGEGGVRVKIYTYTQKDWCADDEHHHGPEPTMLFNIVYKYAPPGPFEPRIISKKINEDICKKGLMEVYRAAGINLDAQKIDITDVTILINK